MSDVLDQEAGEDAADSDGFRTMLDRLSRLSVDRHFEAYTDVAWDSSDMALVPDDPRLDLPGHDPLGASEWYRSQPAAVRARIGLYRYAAFMKVGWHFENLLQRGLLRYAFTLPNGAPEFRYLHHEIIEESQHTLMFQEFTNRSRLPVRGMPRSLRVLAELTIVPLSRWFPSMFFVFVLGGEDPIDHLQRRQLEDGAVRHPLVERIMRIHVTEEARHLSFARHHLRHDVPALGFVRRHLLAAVAPIVLGIMSRLMLRPPADLVRNNRIPRSVVRQAFGSLEGSQLLKDSVAKTRRLWVELGLVNPASKLLWKAAGIWDEPSPPNARRSAGAQT